MINYQCAIIFHPEVINVIRLEYTHMCLYIYIYIYVLARGGPNYLSHCLHLLLLVSLHHWSTFTHYWNSFKNVYMLTSSRRNVFRVTGLFCGEFTGDRLQCGEFTGDRWNPYKGQWRRPLMVSLICAWTNGWINNRDDGDLRSIVLIMTSL